MTATTDDHANSLPTAPCVHRPSKPHSGRYLNAYSCLTYHWTRPVLTTSFHQADRQQRVHQRSIPAEQLLAQHLQPLPRQRC